MLEALKRMMRAQTGSEIPELDVDGVADVLGVDGDRVRSVLRELLLEGLAEPAAPHHGRSAQDGSCRITGDGLRALRERTDTAVAKVIHVDDIDSFERVRGVSPSDVVDMLEDELLPTPESEVKRLLCDIIGENYEHKDWGG